MVEELLGVEKEQTSQTFKSLSISLIPLKCTPQLFVMKLLFTLSPICSTYFPYYLYCVIGAECHPVGVIDDALMNT